MIVPMSPVPALLSIIGCLASGNLYQHGGESIGGSDYSHTTRVTHVAHIIEVHNSG